MRAILLPVLSLMAPITLTIITIPVVPIPTATGDENAHAAEPGTPAGRARGPPRLPIVAVTRRRPPSHIHPRA